MKKKRSIIKWGPCGFEPYKTGTRHKGMKVVVCFELQRLRKLGSYQLLKGCEESDIWIVQSWCRYLTTKGHAFVVVKKKNCYILFVEGERCIFKHTANKKR